MIEFLLTTERATVTHVRHDETARRATADELARARAAKVAELEATTPRMHDGYS